MAYKIFFLLFRINYSFIFSIFLISLTINFNSFVSIDDDASGPFELDNFTCFSILIFFSLCLHRYLKGSRVWSIFLVVYILLFHYSFPFLLFSQIGAIFFKITISLMTALFFTSLLIYILNNLTSSL